MSNKKFFALVSCVMLLFAVLFSAGCGGSGEPLDSKANNEPDNPLPSGFYTVIFDSDGGTEIESQDVTSLEPVIEPVEPEKEGFTFMGWHDTANNNLFFFGVSVDRDILLKAEWAKTISATNEELAELKKSEYEGRIVISLDRGGVLTSCEVNYQTDGFALVGVSELENDPMNNAAE